MSVPKYKRSGASRGLYRATYGSLLDDEDFKSLSPDARHLFHAIKISRISNVAGIFICGKGEILTLSEQTGMSFEGVSDALRMLSETHWVYHDQGVAWIRNGLKFDPTFTLTNKNHKKAVENVVSGLPKCLLVAKFCKYYKLDIIIETPNVGVSEPIGEGLANPMGIKDNDNDNDKEKDNDNEKDKEQDKDKDNEQDNDQKVKPQRSEKEQLQVDVEQVHSYYCTITNRNPKLYELSPAMFNLIAKSIKWFEGGGYADGVEAVCASIKGCTATPWNAGDNKENTPFWDLEKNILRDFKTAEKWLNTFLKRNPGSVEVKEKEHA